MVKKISKVHSDETRAKIQAGVLIDRLHKCAMGKVILRPEQVRSATALLNKVLPDLKAVELSPGDGGPLTVQIVNFSGEGAKTKGK